ncbi:bifunctional [glutamate--ammonia ligase]-adenylyl-L-tyrosine phosphorylase/[glutamate--ammonia-ligase] adenylyltransferase [Desulfonema magnum]|uniref:Bifunctional glutamine synthetase adenylyltransferase/adenylyl-removing enzyme n=1 Tax=Desulfonema magnum TaxID=45655 RepID=A0A975BVU9_9BACT|nr:bifunctional [glutamate--ammonia ligase]-adenylyl-L-tyrosine phosphorylase/[glutamate--ammonia-ligase] adenylyltransferase [Desulfonema magnum]QTA92765.1 Bifunctional glutamine synthetase adenylyltransferase/adenylyl-removing enzyme [Desulfonema magnum]
MTNDKWDEFCVVIGEAGISSPDDPEMTAELERVFAFSDFVTRSCIRNPELLEDLIKSGDLKKTYTAEEYDNKLKAMLSGTEDEANLGRVLRCVRRREMVRIACRDLSGRADLSETMADLSAFAEACIEHALSFLYEWECSKFGVPTGTDGSQQYLVVLGMGKLGAYELNFSSDIDLIFAYSEPGETIGGPACVTNEEFFVRLCRRLLNVLGATSADGIVFRTDMGLRPYGESGPLVMNFDAMETYYQMQGREWERYAWIKARVVAGDKIAGAGLLKSLNPFIYRRYLDFGVFESLREMKQKISLEVRRKGMKDNIKLGPGGIREIEFFGQIFQLIRGGVVHSLQERGIQNILRILVRENHIEQNVCDELEAAYIFLRNTEHRLQEFSDQQTHQLPSDAPGQERLSGAMGFSDREAFASHLETHMENVHRHFNTLLETKASEKGDEKTENDLEAVWLNLTEQEHSREVIKAAGFENPDEVLQLLNHLHDDLDTVTITREGRERIDKLVPLILRQISMSEPSAPGLNRIIELIKTVKKRTSYISLLLENPAALNHLIRLANSSSWIMSLLARHPVLLDELLDSRTLYVPPGRPELENEIRHRLEQISPDDLEWHMEELRIFKQTNTLRVAAADITEALPLMRVSDHLSSIAETVLNKVVELAWNHLVEIHGEPTCYLGQDTFERGFAVIAYGKLGGLELGYDSDLDLVFLHAGTDDQTIGGKRPTENSHFFGRLGQRVIHILTAPTSAGLLYEADMRLRPSGKSGVLVCHIEGFRDYQFNEAWTWEKQAIIKARAIIGSPRMIRRFEEIRTEVLARPRDKAKLREEVMSMRDTMRKELLKYDPETFDLKQGPGGMVDIEFLVQYLVLLKSHEHPELLEWTDNVRLIGTLAKTGIIDDITAYFLRKAYLTYRTVGHRLSLRKRPAKVPESQFRELREKVKEIYGKILQQQSL